jgi:hypothetical protein
VGGTAEDFKKLEEAIKSANDSAKSDGGKPTGGAVSE